MSSTIGRVIRHRNDFGAVLFMDKRFAEKTDEFSQWIKGSVRNYDSFKTCLPELRNFFKTFTEGGGVESLPAEAHPVPPCEPAAPQTGTVISNNADNVQNAVPAVSASSSSSSSSSSVSLPASVPPSAPNEAVVPPPPEDTNAMLLDFKRPPKDQREWLELCQKLLTTMDFDDMLKI